MEIDAGAIVSLESTVAELGRVVQQYRDELHRSSSRPRPVLLVAQATADANGNAVLAFPACSYGREQSVRRIAVGGATWGGTAPGSAVITVGSSAPSPDNPVATIAVLDHMPTLPSVNFYPGDRHLVPVLAGNSLFVVINGGTSGLVYAATATVDDYPAL